MFLLELLLGVEIYLDLYIVNEVVYVIFAGLPEGKYFVLEGHVELGHDYFYYFLDVFLEIEEKLGFLLMSYKLIQPISPQEGDLGFYIFTGVEIKSADTFRDEGRFMMFMREQISKSVKIVLVGGEGLLSQRFLFWRGWRRGRVNFHGGSVFEGHGYKFRHRFLLFLRFDEDVDGISDDTGRIKCIFLSFLLGRREIFLRLFLHVEPLHLLPMSFLGEVVLVPLNFADFPSLKLVDGNLYSSFPLVSAKFRIADKLPFLPICG